MNFLLDLYVQPGANKTEIVGEHGQRLKIRLKASPVDDKANKELIRFIATLLNVRKQDITIVRGQRNRLKTLSIVTNPDTIKKLTTLQSSAAD